MKLLVGAALGVIVLVLASCTAGSSGNGSPGVDTGAPPRLVVATSTVVLADLVRSVGGPQVEVISLVPPDRTPPLFELSPRDGVAVSKASVFFANGYGYESPSIGQLILSTSGLRVALLSDGQTAKETVIDHGDHDHRFPNAYFYLDPRRAMEYVERIRVVLSEVDPGSVDRYTSNARAYRAQLEELDQWIQSQVQRVPAPNRSVLTDQASFPYFAERYGLASYAASYEGTSETTPSPSQYAYLIEQVKQWRVPVAFGEEGTSAKLIQQLARDTGIRYVPGLRTSTFDAGSGVDSYIAMMRRNTEIIVQALS